MKSVGVKFKKNGKEYIFDDNNNNVKINDYVIVETEKGQQFGYVSTIIENELKQKEYSKIIKIATKKEIDQNKKNIEEAKDALKKATDIAKKMKLDMKFLDADFTFDKTQLIFHFIAENRVDFR